MTRIFLFFACFAILVVALTMLLGLGLGDFQGTMREIQQLELQQQAYRGAGQGGDTAALDRMAAQSKELRQVEPWARMHRLAGMGASLVVVLVYSLVVTYFIGTSRWCKEVVEAYQLDRSIAREATRIKRRAFPWALLGMLWAIGLVASGAAADPATGRANTEWWVAPHFWVALLGIGWLAWSFTVLYRYIAEQHAVVQRIIVQVRDAREARGLEV